MKKKIIIDMFSLYRETYFKGGGINQIIGCCLSKVNQIIPSQFEEGEEVYFIFESKQHQRESYENNKEFKESKKNHENYEMGKNYIIEILKVESDNFRIIKIPRNFYDLAFSELCKTDKKSYIEIYSKNMLLCKNLNLNVVYRNDSDFITYDSFLESYGFLPNKYSITFYFFLKDYIESEIMDIIMRSYDNIDSFKSFNNYIQNFDFSVQTKIRKSIKKIKEVFEFYNYDSESGFNLSETIHYCKNNPIKKDLLLNSVGIRSKKVNDAEKFFDI